MSVVLAIFAPTLAELLVAFHNRISVYPYGTDTNMFANSIAVRVTLLTLLAGIAAYFLPVVRMKKVLLFLCFVVILNLGVPALIPSFIPSDWCKYELTIYPCEEGRYSYHPYPNDVLGSQILTSYEVHGDMYALVFQPNSNWDLGDLNGREGLWHGVMQSKGGTQPWTKFFTITDPVDLTGSSSQLKYNPAGVYYENGELFVDIVNDRGAGSGEGQLIRFVSNDLGQTWARRGCFYFVPEQYYAQIGGETMLNTFDPISLTELNQNECAY